MKKFSVLALTFILGVMTGVSPAGEVVLFGPRKYVRTNSEPVVSSETFRAIYGGGRLLIKNGLQPDVNKIEDAVTSAIVKINGEVVFGSNDFNPKVSELAAPLKLLENNTVDVELRGQPGSYLTIEVFQEVDPPAAVISAEPSVIQRGQASVISWESLWADSAVIEPGIGAVDLQGSIQVSPLETTNYTLTTRGLGGTVTESVVVTVRQMDLEILQPADGQQISGVETIVQGKISGQNGEVGVTVNGFPAEVNGALFFADHVKLTEGSNKVKVVATDESGYSVTKDVDITADVETPRIEVSVNPQSGIAPFKALLQADHFLPEVVTDSSLSWAGPSEPNIAKVSLNEYRIEIGTPGVYTFTYNATIGSGGTYQQAAMVNVLSIEVMDQRLRSKWDGLKTALRSGNADRAADCMAFGSRQKYRYNFDLLKDHLTEIADSFQGMDLARLSENMAEYNLWATQNGQTYNYHLVFIKDTDGIWRIRSF